VVKGLKLIGIDGSLTLNFIVLWGFKRLNYALMVKKANFFLHRDVSALVNWNSPLQFSASDFAKVNSLYNMMIYERNDSLRGATGPSITFNSIELHEQKANIKLTEQLPCDSLDGGPPGQNIV
jgi:hypothetical protein